MKAEYLAEEIRDGIKKLKERLDIPPAEDHDDLIGYMDALIADSETLMKMLGHPCNQYGPHFQRFWG